MSALFDGAANMARGQTLVDSGFESYSVSSGGFVKPDTGPWLFANDAGVVEPFAPNSSTGALNTWSATFAAIEGQQYASTYAAGDSLRQTVSFPAAGLYRLSVFAAAPSGSLTIPSVGTVTLGDGEFTFLLNNTPVGSLHAVPAGSSWGSFNAEFPVAAPGDYQVGLRNTRTAAYFVNYDVLTVTPVPEPTVLQLVAALGVGTVFLRIFKRAN